MKKFLALKTVFSFSALFLLSNVARSAGPVLKAIEDPKVVTHLRRHIFRKTGDKAPVVVVSLFRDQAWINVDGHVLELPGKRETEEGKKFRRNFAKADAQLSIDYEVLSSALVDGECERTEYKLSVEYSDSKHSEKFSPQAYGEGC